MKKTITFMASGTMTIDVKPGETVELTPGSQLAADAMAILAQNGAEITDVQDAESDDVL